jgi:flagellar biosynthesis anti-sigma factor FlgM
MRVDLTNYGSEPPEKSKLGRAGQSGTAAAAATASEASASGSSSALDRASFSFDQARVQSLASQALAAPEVRRQTVASLQQAVAGGSYTVDSAKVADAIASDASAGILR